MKLVDEGTFDAYITFIDHTSANQAYRDMIERKMEHLQCSAKLINHLNVKDEEYDFIPKNFDGSSRCEIVRKNPTLTWHVATYKEGRTNFIRASECLEKKVGNIPQGNIKRYGKNLLIKAGNETQAALLTNFSPSSSGNIESLSPHKTFNTKKGVIYSEDLYDFTEDEILERCPPNVYAVRKLKGNNNSILLTFTSSYVPDYIMIRHLRIRVKKWISKPNQCFRCYEYGHVESKCSNRSKCFICSGEHDLGNQCSSTRFCFHCKGNHSPNSRVCDRYKFEQDIIEIANNEHISLGSAKRRLMGANRNPDSSYASVVKELKRPSGAISAHKEKLDRRPDVHPNDSTPLPEKDSSEPVVNDKSSITMETESSTITITKKDSSKDGFTHHSSKKRGRTSPPRNNSFSIKTSNSFSALDEVQVVKRKALQKSNSEVNLKDMSCRPKEQMPRTPCQPKEPRKGEAESLQLSKVIDSKADCNVSGSVKVRSSREKSDSKTPLPFSHLNSDSRRSRLSKANFSHSEREKNPQSISEKTGKKEN